MSGIVLQEVGGDLVIKVPDEQTLVGRGQFLQVTDKRVSRSHAILDVIDRKVYITPNHTNPSFLRVKGSDASEILPKDVKQVLHHGDSFGLLPEQLYYRVSYPQVNGKDRGSEVLESKSNDVIKEVEKTEAKKTADVPTTPEIKNGTDKEKDIDEDWDKTTDEVIDLKSESKIKPEKTQDNKTEPDENKTIEEKKEVKTAIGNVALPLNKKRPLPAWMTKMAIGSPTKAKPAVKKTSTAVNKRQPGQKISPVKDDDDEEEESVVPNVVARVRAARYDDDDDEEDFDEHVSDDDYVPEATAKRGRSKRKRTYSESDEDDFSDDDDDDEDYYASKKKKSKTPKKSPKGKGKKGGKGRQKPSPRKTPARRKKKNQSDDDDDENVLLPRRGNFDDDDDDDDDMDGSGRRPQRAARQKRGSYVDDPMIEEALDDFASENDDVDLNEQKDSDFDLDGVDDSGSDWDSKKNNSQKQKVQKFGKPKGSPRGLSKKGKKKTPRRPSRNRSISDDDDDLEDDEPYVPRPSKRRGGGGASQRSDESEDEKKRRKREPCQYGAKCYRKNPVHFRTYCHPGDLSYDEDEDNPTSKDTNRREKDSNKTTAEKPSRPQRSTAGTRLVTQGSVVDDDLPDTYDYNDSFIDDGTQVSDDSANDSDYDAGKDVRSLAKDAKKLIKNKKVAQNVQD